MYLIQNTEMFPLGDDDDHILVNSVHCNGQKVTRSSFKGWLVEFLLDCDINQFFPMAGY